MSYSPDQVTRGADRVVATFKAPGKKKERVEAPTFSEQERRRRERAKWDVHKAAEACERLNDIIIHRVIDRGGEQGDVAREGIALREILIGGQDMGSKPIGEPGVNVTQVMNILDTRLEGEGQMVKVIAKPASGEKTFAYDAEEDTVLVVSKRAHAGGDLERVRTDPNVEFAAREQEMRAKDFSNEAIQYFLGEARVSHQRNAKKAKEDANDFPGFARQIAKEYGVKDQTIIGLYLEESGLSPEEIEDLWLSGDDAIKAHLELTFRKGQPPGMGHAREFVFSQVDKLFGFGVVPETVLRPEQDADGSAKDVMSVQQLVQARELTDAELTGLGSLDREDPKAKQLMRMAVLDYLMGTTDRHGGNILIDEKTGSLKAIDNAYCMGLSTLKMTKDYRSLGILSEGQFNNPDPYVSVAMEFARHSQMELDEEALAGIRDFYEKTTLYITERPRFKILAEKYKTSPGSMNAEELALHQKMETVGEYPKFMTDLFRLAFRSDGSDADREKIVQQELEAFMERCAYILKYRRLPDIPNHSPAISGIVPKFSGEWKNASQQPPNPFAAAAE